MQLAYDHVERMLETHHVESFKNMVLLRGDILRDSREHRRIDITWKICTQFSSAALMLDLAKYRGEGYRCIDTVINGRNSSLRLVRGQLTAEEELRYKLESRSFLNFDVQDATIKMEFATRTKEELSAYEKETLKFLKTIKDYSITYDYSDATMLIGSFTAEVLDKDGNVRLLQKFQNEITTTGEQRIVFDKVHSDKTLSLATTYLLCPDCKDGYYYPLIGPRERCKTCC